jgi:hypothetical protein
MEESGRKYWLLRYSSSAGSTGVPLIDMKGINITGYNPGAIKAAIEKRRSL